MPTLSVRLPEAAEARLTARAAATGRTKSVLACEAIVEYIDDVEDCHLAEARARKDRTTSAAGCCAPAGSVESTGMTKISSERRAKGVVERSGVEDAKRQALVQAAHEGWADVAAGRVIDIDDDALDEFIAQLGLRASRQGGLPH